MKTRHSARVVLADAERRVLLVRIVDDGAIHVEGEPPPPETYWVTPGGGAEPGESLEQTARREVFEETGIDELVLGPELFAREALFVLRGERLLAIEHYFAGSVVAADATLDHLDALERDVLVEHRWWTVDELADPARDATVFPANILDLVRRAIAVSHTDAGEAPADQ